MSNSGDREQPIVTWSDSESDDPGRGRVVTPEYKAEFNVGQIVYIRASGDLPREGPYKIEKVVMKLRKFTLCDVNSGASAKDGNMFEAEELER